MRSRGSGGPPSKADRKLRSRFTTAATDPNGATRVILQADVVTWLASIDTFEEGHSVLCSLPDISELGFTRDQYTAWWATVAGSLFTKLRPGQFAVFYQSDGKLWQDKTWCTGWLSKAALVEDAAGRAGATLLWHKIATFGGSSGASATMAVGRPGFSHLLCYGAPGGSADGSMAGYDPRASLSPDVFDRGPQLWDRGAGLVAAHVASAFLAAQPQVTTVLSPCCGVGTFPAVANACGLAAVGVELNATRCSDARALRISLLKLVAFREETGTLPKPRNKGKDFEPGAPAEETRDDPDNEASPSFDSGGDY